MSAPVRAALVLAFTFAAGGVAGFFLEHHHRLAAPHAVRHGDAAEHEATLQQLRDLLDLTDDQMERIHAIMAERQDVVEKMWEQLRPEVQAAMRDVHSEIADVLTEQQRRLFHQWLIEHSGPPPDSRPDSPPHPRQ